MLIVFIQSDLAINKLLSDINIFQYVIFYIFICIIFIASSVSLCLEHVERSHCLNSAEFSPPYLTDCLYCSSPAHQADYSVHSDSLGNMVLVQGREPFWS